MSDKIFTQPINKQFEFDEQVASVFDDMLKRSIVYYDETMELVKRYALSYLKEQGVLYDLGCSTANILLNIERDMGINAELIGIDSSDSMLKHASKKLQAFGSNIELINADITSYQYKTCDVIISNYTLQFIRPLVRHNLVKSLYDSLNKGGVFIFSEKVVSSDKRLNKLMIDEYYEFKKEQGYSEYEIVQKREALENVLVPYTQDENFKMLQDSGFSHSELLFRWGNFATFIAIK